MEIKEQVMIEGINKNSKENAVDRRDASKDE
jgi:hypothetical protein